MAISLGTNDLKIFRRHLKDCDRYPDGSKKPFTHRPRSAHEKKADICECPIWCLGYLAKETHAVNGIVKPKRVFASLGWTDWVDAETEVAKLYQTGCLPPIHTKPSAVEIDKSAVTVRYAGERYLASRVAEPDDQIEKVTGQVRLPHQPATLTLLRVEQYRLRSGLREQGRLPPVHGILAAISTEQGAIPRRGYAQHREKSLQHLPQLLRR
jgi:hypothetical protein